MEENKNKIMIKKFEIIGLNGEKDISINFDSRGKILVGENGTGKTTVLNMLYYLISKNYKKLLEYDFKEVNIFFNDDEYFLFGKKDINNLLIDREILYKNTNNLEKMKIHDFYNKKLDEYHTFANLMNNEIEYDDIKNDFIIFIEEDLSFRLSKEHFGRVIMSFILFSYEKVLSSLNINILYLPTYRRVEESLKSLEILKGNSFLSRKIQKEIEEHDFMNFGMDDVDAKIKELEKEIDIRTQAGYSNLTKNVLKSFAKNDFSEALISKILVNNNKIQQVLERFEGKIEDEIKDKILKVVKDKKQLEDRKDLSYFILGLIDIYDDVYSYEQKLIDFMDKCNEYLHDKQFDYHPTDIKLRLEKKDTIKTRLELDSLSSGEKQILSIFSKIYLENDESLFIIFDEPELSLSVIWQEKILADIYRSDKCKFLLSATHSPFIYDNELEELVDSIEVFTTPYNDKPF